MPEGPLCVQLATWIDRLARRLGTTPFLPHLTLVPGIALPEREAGARTARVAAAIDPFTVMLAAVEGRDEHFRCLFVRAHASGALQAAHATAARAFGREPDPGFLPHLSLVYGALRPGQKHAIAREIGEELRVSFEASQLHLWRTDGPVAEWREIGAFPMPELPGPTPGCGPRTPS